MAEKNASLNNLSVSFMIADDRREDVLTTLNHEMMITKSDYLGSQTTSFERYPCLE